MATYQERRVNGTTYSLIETTYDKIGVVNHATPMYMHDHRHVGVNSSFFEVATGKLHNISYQKGGARNHLTNVDGKRKTMIVFNNGASMATTVAKDVAEIESRYSNVITAIGGREILDLPDSSKRPRSFIGIKNGKAYLGITRTELDGVTPTQLRQDLIDLGFLIHNVVGLDGGNSSKMRTPNGAIVGAALARRVPAMAVVKGIQA